MVGRLVSIIIGLMIMYALATLSACTENIDTVYSHFEQISSDGWDPADELIFRPDSLYKADRGAGLYMEKLLFRFSARARIKELPVEITIENLDGPLLTDTVIVSTIEPCKDMTTGVKYGVRETEITLDSALRVSDGYVVSMLPLAPREDSKGLLCVGVIIFKRH